MKVPPEVANVSHQVPWTCSPPDSLDDVEPHLFTVDSLPGMELIFFAVAGGMGLCLGFVLKIVLITQGCFFTAGQHGDVFFFLCCPASRWAWGVHRRLGGKQDIGRGNAAGTGYPDWFSSFSHWPLDCKKDSKWQSVKARPKAECILEWLVFFVWAKNVLQCWILTFFPF